MVQQFNPNHQQLIQFKAFFHENQAKDKRTSSIIKEKQIKSKLLFYLYCKILINALEILNKNN
jgi:hypothetical protein